MTAEEAAVLDMVESKVKAYRDKMLEASCKPHPVTKLPNNVAYCKHDAAESILDMIAAIRGLK